MTPQAWGDPPRWSERYANLRAETLRDVERVIGSIADERGRCFFAKIVDPAFVVVQCRACEDETLLPVQKGAGASTRKVLTEWTIVHIARCFDRPPGGGLAWSEGA